MPLETATYIDGLNSSNPVGSTDKVQTLDDHIRLLKSTILASFPGITGAVTPTHTELNFVDGVTSAIQTQLDTKAAAAALNASNLTSGTVPDARFPATLPAISGANLTSLPAANLTGTLPAISGANLTNLNGTNIASGTVADARLSGNVTLLSASNTFTGATQQISVTGGTFAQWKAIADSSSAWFGVSDASGGGISGDAAGDAYVIGTSGVSISANSGSTLHFRMDSSGNFDFKAGTVTTSNASAAEVGFKGSPINEQNGNYTLVLTDAGKCIYKAAGGAGETITIPANGSVAFPIGTIIDIMNDGGGTLSVAITTDTLVNAAGATGTRTLADQVTVRLRKVTSTRWRIEGATT